jgi:uncharacterized protein (UPF0335 family)
MGLRRLGRAQAKHADNFWTTGPDALKAQGTAASVARSWWGTGAASAIGRRYSGGDQIMTTLQSSAQKQLRQLIEQIERLEEEKKALAGDIRDKYLEAKAVGFDVKALRKIVSLRKKSKTDRQEEEAILAVYMHALGMLDDELQATGADADDSHVMDAAE